LRASAGGAHAGIAKGELRGGVETDAMRTRGGNLTLEKEGSKCGHKGGGW